MTRSRSRSRFLRTPLSVERLEDRLAPAAGMLDLSFSGDGKMAVDVGPYYDGVGSGETTSVVQPDGKTLVGGGGGRGFLVMRFNPDGTLDPTFSSVAADQLTNTHWDGGDGMFSYFTPELVAAGAGGRLVDLALQPDGKIVGIGSGFVMRLHADGSRDAAFGGDGFVALPAVGTSFVQTGVVVQADGRYVVAGYANTGTATRNDFVAVRGTTSRPAGCSRTAPSTRRSDRPDPWSWASTACPPATSPRARSTLSRHC